MSKLIQLYNISKKYSSYSMGHGTKVSSANLAKDLTLEEALRISSEEYGNKEQKMTWSIPGTFSPSVYTIFPRGKRDLMKIVEVNVEVVENQQKSLGILKELGSKLFTLDRSLRFTEARVKQKYKKNPDTFENLQDVEMMIKSIERITEHLKMICP